MEKILTIKKTNITINSFVLYGDEAVFVKDACVAKKNRLESIAKLKAPKQATKLLKDEKNFLLLQENINKRNEIEKTIKEIEEELDKVDLIHAETPEDTLNLQNLAVHPLKAKLDAERGKLKQLNTELLPLIADEDIQDIAFNVDTKNDSLILELQNEIASLENEMIKNILISLDVNVSPRDMTLKEKKRLIELVLQEPENEFPFNSLE